LTYAVLDASVVLKWFRSEGERHRAPALALRERLEQGDLRPRAPRLLVLELLNIAGRRWAWDEDRLVRLTGLVGRLGFAFEEAEPERIARWTARGLTAYDAAYVALAEQGGIPLITDDELILACATDVAVPLAAS
jgi:predicted nucleic acid-binding protein